MRNCNKYKSQKTEREILDIANDLLTRIAKLDCLRIIDRAKSQKRVDDLYRQMGFHDDYGKGKSIDVEQELMSDKNAVDLLK